MLFTFSQNLSLLSAGPERFQVVAWAKMEKYRWVCSAHRAGNYCEGKERIYKIDWTTNLVLEPGYRFSFRRQYADRVCCDSPSASWKRFLKQPCCYNFQTRKWAVHISVQNGERWEVYRVGKERQSKNILVVPVPQAPCPPPFELWLSFARGRYLSANI